MLIIPVSISVLVHLYIISNSGPILFYCPYVLISIDVSLSRSHPIDNAGFLSYTTFSWLTPMMWKMFRNKLDMSSLHLSAFDEAHTSAERSDFFVSHGGVTITHRTS